jgi:phosphonate transport system permease protein
LALAITNGGAIGKLYGELAEAVDPRPIRALRASGAGRLGVVIHGVLPQVRRQWVAYALFRLECSLRSASILGVVGAGGLGMEIALSIRYFELDKLSTALLATLVFVGALEIASGILRRRAMRWSLGFAMLGAAVALATLDIPWASLLGATTALLEAWTASAGASNPLAPIVGRASILTAETLAMAWSATMVAAAFAFLLAPCASPAILIRGFLRHAYAHNSPITALAWVFFFVVRIGLQVARSLPEITLALVFIVWVGPGPFAGFLAVLVHTVGVLGRLYADSYEDAEPEPARALEAAGGGVLARFAYGILPQVAPRKAAYTLYRFELNVRETAMVGFVGAGGIGDALHTAISLFHMFDLAVLIGVMVTVVAVLDAIGSRARARLLRPTIGYEGEPWPVKAAPVTGYGAEEILAWKALTQVERASHAKQRRFQRKYIPLHCAGLELFYRVPDRDDLVRAYTMNISPTGLFIRDSNAFPRGLTLRLYLVSDELERPFESYGRIVYTQEKAGEVPGFGVEFLDPEPAFLEALNQLGDRNPVTGDLR